jgi:hypothetical protein
MWKKTRPRDAVSTAQRGRGELGPHDILRGAWYADGNAGRVVLRLQL